MESRCRWPGCSLFLGHPPCQRAGHSTTGPHACRHRRFPASLPFPDPEVLRPTASASQVPRAPPGRGTSFQGSWHSDWEPQDSRWEPWDGCGSPRSLGRRRDPSYTVTGQVSEDFRFQKVSDGPGSLRPCGPRWLWCPRVWAARSPSQLSLDTSQPYLWGLGSHLPAFSGTTPRILITVPTRMPSGSDVLWGTFCGFSGGESQGTGGADERHTWVGPRQKASGTQIGRIREKKRPRDQGERARARPRVGEPTTRDQRRKGDSREADGSVGMGWVHPGATAQTLGSTPWHPLCPSRRDTSARPSPSLSPVPPWVQAPRAPTPPEGTHRASRHGWDAGATGVAVGMAAGTLSRSRSRAWRPR